MKVKCPVCGKDGKLMYKNTKTKTTTGEYKEYRKLYVYHGKPNQKWCYLKQSDLKEIPKRALEQLQESTTQTTTQMLHKQNKAQESLIPQNNCGHSLVWFRTSACHADDPGSNPGDRTTEHL